MSRRRKSIVVHNVSIDRAGAKGVSFGKLEDGKTVMVQNAVLGDVVDLEIYKKHRRYDEGKAIHFHSYSPFRTEAKCKHFGTCGGCKWQNLSYQKQLELKQTEVTGNIQKIAKINNFQEIPILASSQEYFYRNKMEFSFSDSRWLTQEEIEQNDTIENRNALGFHIPKMWSKILDLEECFLQQEPSNSMRLAIRNFAIENHISFYSPLEKKGELRSLLFRNNSQNEWMIVLQFFEENVANRQKLLHFIQTSFPEVKSLLYANNPKANDSIYDLDINCFSGELYLSETLDNLNFRIGPKSFFQTNYKQAKELYTIVKNWAELSENETVYDLYTGTGTIAQYISDSCKKVIGIESVFEAIASAKEYAVLNNIKNVVFYCGDMKDLFTDEFVAQNGKPNVIITDPPRDGMHKKVVEQILKLAPEKVVYVSCNSATQARDLELLKVKYTLEKLQAVDMFPQTFHVESIAMLRLK